VLQYNWKEYFFLEYTPLSEDIIRPPKGKVIFPPKATMLIRDCITIIVTIAMSVFTKMRKRLLDAQKTLQEAEKCKAEAELLNLQNKINPHFLLNTLNNIYALISIDTSKAQQSVLDLSKMLRYMLYNDNNEFVPISKEIDFIGNYIELMKIRLNDNVKVNVNITVDDNSDIKIAPLLFISLIENAFKHGVSPDKPCFININIRQTADSQIVCDTSNSNFPKNSSDKSGSGIGLKQVQKHLDILYNDNYSWQKYMENNVYHSILIINTNTHKI